MHRARVAVWLLLPWTGLHDVWDPAPAPWGENLGACWRRLDPQRLRAQVGRVAFKKGGDPLGGQPCLRAPLMHRAFPPSEPPGGGTPAILPPCHRRNATSWKLVPFSHRSASRIFIMQPGCIPSPVVTQDGDLQLDGGEKRAGLRSWSRPQLQGCSSSSLGRRQSWLRKGGVVGQSLAGSSTGGTDTGVELPRPQAELMSLGDSWPRPRGGRRSRLLGPDSRGRPWR
jgi:hypothetical protein